MQVVVLSEENIARLLIASDNKITNLTITDVARTALMSVISRVV